MKVYIVYELEQTTLCDKSIVDKVFQTKEGADRYVRSKLDNVDFIQVNYKLELLYVSKYGEVMYAIQPKLIFED